MTRLSVRFVVAFALLAPVSRADTKITVQTTINDSGAKAGIENPVSHSTVYYRRQEMRRKDSGRAGNESLSELADCATRTGFLIDLEAGEYRSYRLAIFRDPAQLHQYAMQNPSNVVDVVSKTVDTGERKMFFGHSATHLVTTLQRTSKGNDVGEEIIDGWYIEHESADQNCAPEYVHQDPAYLFATALVMYPQVANFKHTGPMPKGLPLRLKRTLHFTSGRTVVPEEEVISLSDSELPGSLFVLATSLRENPKLRHGEPNIP